MSKLEISKLSHRNNDNFVVQIYKKSVEGESIVAEKKLRLLSSISDMAFINSQEMIENGM